MVGDVGDRAISNTQRHTLGSGLIERSKTAKTFLSGNVLDTCDGIGVYSGRSTRPVPQSTGPGLSRDCTTLLFPKTKFQMKVRVIGEGRFVSARAASRLIRVGQYESASDFSIRKATGGHSHKAKHRLPVAEANQTSLLDGKTWRHHNERCASYGEDVRTYGVLVA
jgi:hypothetical protein